MITLLVGANGGMLNVDLTVAAMQFI